MTRRSGEAHTRTHRQKDGGRKEEKRAENEEKRIDGDERREKSENKINQRKVGTSPRSSSETPS